MGTIPLIRFSSQTNPEILNALRQIADIEGKKFYAVLDEAFRDFLNKKLCPCQIVWLWQALHKA
jgi:hypothetical protein